MKEKETGFGECTDQTPARIYIAAKLIELAKIYRRGNFRVAGRLYRETVAHIVRYETMDEIARRG